MSNEWLPSPRAERLAMAKNRLYVIGQKPDSPPWGIPAARVTELANLTAAADGILAQAMSSDRTHSITVACKVAFEALDGIMRFFKKYYFLVPSLAEKDLADLGFKEAGPPTPIGKPGSQPVADLVFPGIHLAELQKIRPAGDPPPDPRGNYGVRIHYGFFGSPTAAYPLRHSGPPTFGKDLPYSLFTRRKKERFDFEGESGNTVYFCLIYENSKGGGGVLRAVLQRRYPLRPCGFSPGAGPPAPCGFGYTGV
jgi:hypothetical protein